MTGPATTRSPAAPSRSLAKCYAISAELYDSYSHTEFGAPEVAGAANLSATSGPGKSLVSDLKQYDLIAKTGAGKFVITEEFKNLHMLTEGSPEFKAVAYEFVKRPVVFQKVLVDVKGKLPEEAPLANILRSTSRFNPDKARATARALSESLEWVGVLDAKRNIIEPRPGKGHGTVGNAVVTDAGISGDIADGGVRVDKAGLLTLEIPLADLRSAHVRFPFDLTPEEAAKIGRVLAAICG